MFITITFTGLIFLVGVPFVAGYAAGFCGRHK